MKYGYRPPGEVVFIAGAGTGSSELKVFLKGYRKKPARMKIIQAANWTHPK